MHKLIIENQKIAHLLTIIFEKSILILLIFEL